MSSAPLDWTRRRWLTQNGAWLGAALAGAASPLVVPPGASADAADQPAKPAADPKPLPPLNRFPRMVQEHFVRRVREVQREADARRAALATRADAERYVQSVRERIRRAFGPEPPRTPLNARVVRTTDRERYRIENVIFESRPGFLVTANLYVPRERKGPFPGVVGSCGHSLNGKAGDAYQPFAQSLASQGFLTLIFDPIGQGERLQYVDEQLRPRRGVGTSEHLHAGNQQTLVGEFFGAWRAWDGIRALDYLFTRPELDPRHVGITGNSGGGTLTTWLAALDSRWTMAAPGCFVTTFLRNLENELPADTEQCPPRVLEFGLDHSDFLAALAPKPVIILAKERDYFDVRGAEEAFARLRRLYELLGAADRVKLHVGPTEHGYSQENREAMYAWFRRATTGEEGPVAEGPIVVEKDETLWCTPRGQVAELGSRTVFSFTKELAQRKAAARPQLDDAALRTAIRETLALPPTAERPPEYRILRPLAGRGYPKPHATTYAVETDPDVFALVTRLGDRPHYSRPPRGESRAVLYVSHHSADADLREQAWLRTLVEQDAGATWFACDVRGTGESRPDTCGADQFARPYGSDYFYAAHALMLGRPYVGQKTFDVLRTLDWLVAAGCTHVRLVARGWGTLPATFAAVLSDVVREVTLRESLDSFASQAEDENYAWPLSSFPPDVLARFDLPDCYAHLAKHKRLDRGTT